MPLSIMPNSVFDINCLIGMDRLTYQLLKNGKQGVMNVGAVLILPEGFRMHDARGLIQPYSVEHQNILVSGPLANTVTLAFTIEDVNQPFGTVPIYVGANAGRGQLYPDGTKSNNTIWTSPIEGIMKTVHYIGNHYYLTLSIV
eukprot:TRINITY_DN1391_c1_g1_i3.p2 TRINITY_DN1391_c1_g1~~TRINITY_DN1391_c1_g1_i3.p2  ORF type:complete len:143 (+),score=2.41 TRINITY_DN1391_c1_g1_i3:314-742(+)